MLLLITDSPWHLAIEKHEQDKRRDYDERVREVEHGCFTPLALFTTGGFGSAASIVRG